MTIPGVSERLEQLFQISIGGPSGRWIARGMGCHWSTLINSVVFTLSAANKVVVVSRLT